MLWTFFQYISVYNWIGIKFRETKNFDFVSIYNADYKPFITLNARFSLVKVNCTFHCSIQSINQTFILRKTTLTLRVKNITHMLVFLSLKCFVLRRMVFLKYLLFFFSEITAWTLKCAVFFCGDVYFVCWSTRQKAVVFITTTTLRVLGTILCLF